MPRDIRVAACHAAPVFLSAQETTKKAIALVREAASNDASLVIFPETYIPAFPAWSSLRPPTDNHDFFQRMSVESIYADGPEIDSLRREAKRLGVMISIGFSEKVRYSSATLFNSNIFVDNHGRVVVHHRKLMPTFFEKLTWSPGDGHGLQVADTEFGKVGTLICGENTNPLARYTLMAQGEQLHISTWPAVWPTRLPQKAAKPTDQQDEGSTSCSGPPSSANYDNVAANRTRAAAHCFEAKCFGVLCAGVLGQDAIDSISQGAADHVREALNLSQRGATMFLDPTGALLPGYVVNNGSRIPTDYLQKEEGILYGNLDLDACIEGKQYHDVVGGYQRLDVFSLSVNRTRHNPINFV